VLRPVVAEALAWLAHPLPVAIGFPSGLTTVAAIPAFRGAIPRDSTQVAALAPAGG
jgi:hypothetical protein